LDYIQLRICPNICISWTAYTYIGSKKTTFLFLQVTAAHTEVRKHIRKLPLDERSVENFDAQGYLAGAKLKEGQDPYANNAYNQKASEDASFNRDPPDVRHSQ
jgi:hypothetical protein